MSEATIKYKLEDDYPINQTWQVWEMRSGNAWYADTEWTPVFAVLSGIVFDVGSVGDHAAITAREFGIPAVFACGDASRRIPEGAWVTVDGDKGVVEWE